MQSLENALRPLVEALRTCFPLGDVHGLTRQGRRGEALVRFGLEPDSLPISVLNTDVPLVSYFTAGRGRFETVAGSGRGRANTYRVEQRVTLVAGAREANSYEAMLSVFGRFGNVLELEEVNFDASAIVRAETGQENYDWDAYIFTLGFRAKIKYD